MNVRSIKAISIIALLVLLFLQPLHRARADEPLLVKYLGNNTDSISEDYYLAIIGAALNATESTYGSYQLVFT